MGALLIRPRSKTPMHQDGRGHQRKRRGAPHTPFPRSTKVSRKLSHQRRVLQQHQGPRRTLCSLRDELRTLLNTKYQDFNPVRNHRRHTISPRTGQMLADVRMRSRDLVFPEPECRWRPREQQQW